MRSCIIFTVTCLLGFTSFSQEPFVANTKITNTVPAAFTRSFANAVVLDCAITGEYMRVWFSEHEQKKYAYYNSQGELIAITRNISIAQLPLRLNMSLHEKYPSHYLADLFEVANDEGTNYYATFQNKKSRIIICGTVGGKWEVYKKDNDFAN